MKNLINVSSNLTFASVLKFQDFEKLSKYELRKVKGGSTSDDPPVVNPD